MSLSVLYIESDAPTRERVQSLLGAVGFSVQPASGALEGLERAHAAAPDLLLAGTRLPDLRNAELLARLRRDPGLGQVPLVAVGNSPSEREVALAAGWDGFIARSVDDSGFVAQVRAYRGGKRERLSGEERRARQLLADRERRGSVFIHDLAHELSTPLTPLAGYLKILGSERLGALSPQQRKVIDGMTTAVSRLTRIVDNLSDFANLQAGSAAISLAAVEPEAMTQAVVEDLRPAAKEAYVHVEVRLASGPPILADPRKLRQALANLVGNAVKFSPHGGEVLVAVTREARQVRFAVYDQGPGVPQADQERVFEPFSHGERREEARLPGSGLGLPVARRIGEAHGGHVTVESPPLHQPGGAHPFTGSLFVMEIPARPVPEAADRKSP